MDKMNKSNNKYFEGIFQLRNITQEIIDFIEKKLNKTKELNISKIVEQKNGLDLYMTDKRKMERLALDLQKEFGGILKKSPQLFSKNRQTSKNIYRLNICLKFCDFKKGDVIKTNNKYIKITNIGKKISGIDLIHDKRVSLDVKDFELLREYKTIISKIKPRIEVIHPVTFQSVPINNKAKVKLEQKVNVAVNDKVFIV